MFTQKTVGHLYRAPHKNARNPCLGRRLCEDGQNISKDLIGTRCTTSESKFLLDYIQNTKMDIETDAPLNALRSMNILLHFFVIFPCYFQLNRHI